MFIPVYHTCMHINHYQYSVVVVTLFSLKRKHQQKILCPFEEPDQYQVPLTKKKPNPKPQPTHKCNKHPKWQTYVQHLYLYEHIYLMWNIMHTLDTLHQRGQEYPGSLQGWWGFSTDTSDLRQTEAATMLPSFPKLLPAWAKPHSSSIKDSFIYDGQRGHGAVREHRGWAARAGSNGPRTLARKNKSGELGGKRLLEAAATRLLFALCLLSPRMHRGRDSPPTHTLPLPAQGCRGV